MKTQRCAIYTRKSTDEGLEQDFNSLHAQREACEAFINSQRHEGWKVLRESYDDGGFSGGSMDRPGLAKLLEAIKAGLIDIIVVYKVDRLTRSLTDFARMVDLFDSHKVSFVSVTQQFNTTTSMGRLTLNVLLSFAQFEREVTAERIRDKIAASKRKGLWMGGVSPLGYEARDKKLAVNATEAETVRTLFNLYLELGTVRALKAEVDRRGIISKVRTYADGRTVGGRPLSRGYLYELLSNPVYIGQVRHKGEAFPGQHQPIIAQEVWDEVQRQLSENAANRNTATNTANPFLLTGLLYDDSGDKMCPTHTSKKGRRYNYYISKRLMHGGDKDHPDGWRIPARPIERIVTDALKSTSDAPPFPATSVLGQRTSLLERVERIDLRPNEVALTLKAEDPSDDPYDSIQTISIPIYIQRRGVERRIVERDRAAADDALGTVIVRDIARAFVWQEQLASGEVTSLSEIARNEGLHRPDVSRILSLAFLAPTLVEGVLEGQAAPTKVAEAVASSRRIDPNWRCQSLGG